MLLEVSSHYPYSGFSSPLLHEEPSIHRLSSLTVWLTSLTRAVSSSPVLIVLWCWALPLSLMSCGRKIRKGAEINECDQVIVLTRSLSLIFRDALRWSFWSHEPDSILPHTPLQPVLPSTAPGTRGLTTHPCPGRRFLLI